MGLLSLWGDGILQSVGAFLKYNFRIFQNFNNTILRPALACRKIKNYSTKSARQSTLPTLFTEPFCLPDH